MKKNIILIVITILFLSCSDNEIIPEVIIPEQSTPTTRSVGDGKYDALGFGYNVIYNNIKNIKANREFVPNLESFIISSILSLSL